MKGKNIFAPTMEKINAVVAKIQKLTPSYEKNVENILKAANDSNKSEHYHDLQIAILYENLLVTMNSLFELKCIVLQLRYDLHNLKDTTEKDQLVLQAYNANEMYEEQKSTVLKLLQDTVDKRKKMKFTLDEVKALHGIVKIITSIAQRINSLEFVK